jgi:hypothetical protein
MLDLPTTKKVVTPRKRSAQMPLNKEAFDEHEPAFAPHDRL